MRLHCHQYMYSCTATYGYIWQCEKCCAKKTCAFSTTSAQIGKLQWSHHCSVAKETLCMELLHTQEADNNCYSQNISYGFFQFLDPSLEVQTATKNQRQTQVMSVVQPIKWCTCIDTCRTVCCLIFHSICRPTLTLMFCVQYAWEKLSFSHTVPLYAAKAHNPFQHDLHALIKTSYSKQFTASICIQASQAESKNTTGEGGFGLCLLSYIIHPSSIPPHSPQSHP